MKRIVSNPLDPVSAGMLALIGLYVWPAPGEAPTEKLAAETKVAIVEKVLAALDKRYVHPEVAKQMDAAVRARLAAGEYASIDDGAVFARFLTEHLQAVSKDKHLRVRFDSEPATKPSAPGVDGASPTPRPDRRASAAQLNYGFERAERLAGNIGYLNLRGFSPEEAAAPTAAAALNFLANTDALILDLRQNGGGEPGMVALLCSYFFGPEPVHLNDLYFRPTNETEEFWTRAEIAGERYLGKDVYVLTSARTFSAAEECAYNLQNLKRATIVGETTGGGANPGDVERLDEHFSVFVPTGRAINPITKTNWEGVGVVPDVPTGAADALKTAHTLALDRAIEKAQDDPRLVRALTEAREHVVSGAQEASARR